MIFSWQIINFHKIHIYIIKTVELLLCAKTLILSGAPFSNPFLQKVTLTMPYTIPPEHDLQGSKTHFPLKNWGIFRVDLALAFSLGFPAEILIWQISLSQKPLCVQNYPKSVPKLFHWMKENHDALFFRPCWSQLQLYVFAHSKQKSDKVDQKFRFFPPCQKLNP